MKQLEPARDAGDLVRATERTREQAQAAHDALSRALGPDRVLVIGDADDFGSLMLWTQYPERRRGRQIARALAGLAHAILDQALDPTTNPPGPDGATGAAIRAAKRALDRLDPDHDAESEDAP